MSEKAQKPTKILVRELRQLSLIANEYKQINSLDFDILRHFLDLNFHCFVLDLFIKHGIERLSETKEFEFSYQSGGRNAYVRVGGVDGLASRFQCNSKTLTSIDGIFDRICLILKYTLDGINFLDSKDFEECFEKNQDGKEEFSLVLAYTFYDEKRNRAYRRLQKMLRELYDKSPLSPTVLDLANAISRILEDNKPKS